MIALPLVALDVLVIALWTIACALAIALIMNKLGAILSGVPYVGGKLSDGAKAMAQAITNACGTMLGGIDHLLGAAWSHLAHYLDGLWNQVESHSSVIAHIARLVGDGLYRVSGLSAIVHGLSRVVHVALHRFVVIGREIFHLGQRVKVLERDISKGIGNDVIPEIKSLDRRITTLRHDLTKDIADAESLAAGEVKTLGNFIGAIPGVRYLDWAAGIVTAALGVEIFKLFRCSSLLNSAKNRGCGLWNGLEDLLGLFVDVLFFASACEILVELSPFISDVAVPAVVALTDVGAGLCQGGIGAPPPLPAVALFLPANPGIALQLP